MYTVAGCCRGRLHPHPCPHGHDLQPIAPIGINSTAIKINSFFIALPAPFLKDLLDFSGRRTPAILRHLPRRANQIGPRRAESTPRDGRTLRGVPKREDLTPADPKL